MGVQADREGSPPGIDAGVVEVPRGIQGHHVRGRFVAGSPQLGDRVLALKLDHAFVGLAQAVACLQRSHGRRNVRHFDAGNHRGNALGVVLGPVGQQRRIAGDEFLGVLGAAPQQDLAEAGAGVHLYDHVAELDGADDREHRVPAALDRRIHRQRLQLVEAHHPVGVDFQLAVGDGFRQRAQPHVQVRMQRARNFWGSVVRLSALIRRWRSFFHSAGGIKRSSRLRNSQLWSIQSRPPRNPWRTASIVEAFNAANAFVRSASLSRSCQTGTRNVGVEARWQFPGALLDQFAQCDDLLHGPLIGMPLEVQGPRTS
jgi:hypothetical protein